jgi:hypothetical protein
VRPGFAPYAIGGELALAGMFDESLTVAQNQLRALARQGDGTFVIDGFAALAIQSLLQPGDPCFVCKYGRVG